MWKGKLMDLGNGGKQIRRRRRADVAQWSDGAVRLLVTVMRLLRKFYDVKSDEQQQQQQQQQQGDNRSKQIWKWVALALHNKGHAFDAVQCKTKFKSLKADYHATIELLDSSLTSSSSHHVVHCDHESELAKFRFFSHMRHYFLASPLTPQDLQLVLEHDGQTAEEFVTKLMKDEEQTCPRIKANKSKSASSNKEVTDAEEEEVRQYRVKKLQLMERKVEVAEQRLQLEVLRAESERQRVENECRRLDMEERKLKQHEEQLMSTANIVNSLLMLLSQHTH